MSGNGGYVPLRCEGIVHHFPEAAGPCQCGEYPDARPIFASLVAAAFGEPSKTGNADRPQLRLIKGGKED
jgi:hypothetical protein